MGLHSLWWSVVCGCKHITPLCLPSHPFWQFLHIPPGICYICDSLFCCYDDYSLSWDDDCYFVNEQLKNLMELNCPITILVGCANPCSYIFRDVHARLGRRVQRGLQLCHRLQCRLPVTMAIFPFSTPYVENFSDKIKTCFYIFVCYRCAQIETWNLLFTKAFTFFALRCTMRRTLNFLESTRCYLNTSERTQKHEYGSASAAHCSLYFHLKSAKPNTLCKNELVLDCE